MALGYQVMKGGFPKKGSRVEVTGYFRPSGGKIVMILGEFRRFLARYRPELRRAGAGYLRFLRSGSVESHFIPRKKVWEVGGVKLLS